MKDVLSLHPKVASHPFEYRFILDPDGIIDFYSTALNCWSPYIIDQKLHRLESFLTILANRYEEKEIYVDWELNKHLPGYEAAVRDLMERLVDFKYNGLHYGLKGERDLYFMGYKTKKELSGILGDFIMQLIVGYLEREGKEIYVEDNTFNLLFARELLELLPDARFIHMVRDPKDVIASLSKQRWTPKDKIQAARWYKGVINRIDVVKKEMPRGSVITVDLCDLVDNTEKTLKDVCAFMETTFSDKILDIDLSRSHRGRWKKEFSADELKKVNQILMGAESDINK
jgi:hypothetical protein